MDVATPEKYFAIVIRQKQWNISMVLKIMLVRNLRLKRVKKEHNDRKRCKILDGVFNAQWKC